jgi:hypothetical protein
VAHHVTPRLEALRLRPCNTATCFFTILENPVFILVGVYKDRAFSGCSRRLSHALAPKSRGNDPCSRYCTFDYPSVISHGVKIGPSYGFISFPLLLLSVHKFITIALLSICILYRQSRECEMIRLEHALLTLAFFWSVASELHHPCPYRAMPENGPLQRSLTRLFALSHRPDTYLPRR